MNELPNPLTGAARAHFEKLVRESEAARREADRVQLRMLRNSLKPSYTRRAAR